jgi:hypothetical protein
VRQPLRLGPKGLLEPERLVTVAHGELVVRVRAGNRVAQERDEAHVRQRLRDARRHGRMEEVVRARLAGQPSARCGDRREVASVPAQAAEALLVEVVDLLVARRSHARVVAELGEERRRPRPLRADHEEVGQAAGARRREAGPAADAHGGVSHVAHRTGGRTPARR